MVITRYHTGIPGMNCGNLLALGWRSFAFTFIRRADMARFRLALISALGIPALAACRGASTPPPTPAQGVIASPTSAAVIPTTTPQPQSTPTPQPPTATPTVAATATPTVPPTPDPNEGVGDVVYADKLDGTGGWYWTYEDDAVSFGISAEQQQLNGTAKQSGTWRFTISPDTVKVGNQQIRVNAHVNVCVGSDEYGLLFRGSADAESNYNFYAFKLRCDGAARLERLQGNDVSVIVDWTTSPAIQPGPNANHALLVWANKDQMRFYVNDRYLFSAQDAALTEGFYGFLLYDQTNGSMSVSWNGLEAKAVTLP
jgi:hypothetical protein